MNKDIEKVLEQTQSQHGFWLINHKNIIQAALTTAIMTKGVDETIELLNETDGQFQKDIYAMIESHKNQQKEES